MKKQAIRKSDIATVIAKRHAPSVLSTIWKGVKFAAAVLLFCALMFGMWFIEPLANELFKMMMGG